MSTKIDEISQTEIAEPQVTPEHVNGDAPAETPAQPRTGGAKPKIWQQRRFRIMAGAVILLLVAGVIANNLIARQYTPDGAVRAYLSDLQSGNGSSAWDEIQVASPTDQVSATLTDKAALQAALAAGKPDMHSFAITQTTYSTPDTAAVSFTYDTSSGSKQGSFVVQRSGQNHFGIYPDWHVLLTPVVLDVSLPTIGGSVSVDGKAVSVAGAESLIAVLPVRHTLTFAGTPMLQQQNKSVDAFFSTQQEITFPPTLSSSGLEKTKAAVNAAFVACAQQTGTFVDGCPQSLESGFATATHWQLIGDPTQDLTVALMQSGLVASGHFTMVAAYQEAGTTGTIHAASAGPYVVPLTLSSNDVSVEGIHSASATSGLERPAGASDQAAKTLVSKAFANCATSTAAAQADCPQLLSFPDVHNIHWTLNSDPLASATVVFDPKTGLIDVSGHLDMTVSYTVSGYPYSRASDTTKYDAVLLWDGQNLQLVTISGDF